MTTTAIKLDDDTMNELRDTVKMLTAIGKRGELIPADAQHLYSTTCLALKMNRALLPITDPERNHSNH